MDNQFSNSKGAVRNRDADNSAPDDVRRIMDVGNDAADGDEYGPILWYNSSIMNMPSRRSLFWDVDPATLDAERHATYIIERILDYGTDEEVRWMYGAYPRELIRNVVDSSRVLRPETLPLWKQLLAT